MLRQSIGIFAHAVALVILLSSNVSSFEILPYCSYDWTSDYFEATSRDLRSLGTDNEEEDTRQTSLVKHEDRSTLGRLSKKITSAMGHIGSALDSSDETPKDITLENARKKRESYREKDIYVDDYGRVTVDIAGIDTKTDKRKLKKQSIHSYVVGSNDNWLEMDENKPDLRSIDVSEKYGLMHSGYSYNSNTCTITFDFEMASKSGDIMDSRLKYFIGSDVIDASNHLRVQVKPNEQMILFSYPDRNDSEKRAYEEYASKGSSYFIREELFEFDEHCIYDPTVGHRSTQVIIDSDTYRILRVELKLTSAPTSSWKKIKHIEKDRCLALFEEAKILQSERDEDYYKEDELKVDSITKQLHRYYVDNRKTDKILVEGEKLMKNHMEEEWYWRNCLGQAIAYKVNVGSKPELEINPGEKKIRFSTITDAPRIQAPRDTINEALEDAAMNNRKKLEALNLPPKKEYHVENVLEAEIPSICGYFKPLSDDNIWFSYQNDGSDSYWIMLKMRHTGDHHPESLHWYTVEKDIFQSYTDENKTQRVELYRDTQESDSVRDLVVEKKTKIDLPAEKQVIFDELSDLIKSVQRQESVNQGYGVGYPESMTLDGDCVLHLNFMEAIQNQRLENPSIPDNFRKLYIKGSKDSSTIILHYYDRVYNYRTNQQEWKKIDDSINIRDCMAYDPNTRDPSRYEIEISDQHVIETVTVKLYNKPSISVVPRVLQSEMVTSTHASLEARKSPEKWIWRSCQGVIAVYHRPIVHISNGPPLMVWTNHPDQEDVKSSSIPFRCTNENPLFATIVANDMHIVFVQLQRGDRNWGNSNAFDLIGASKIKTENDEIFSLK